MLATAAATVMPATGGDFAGWRRTAGTGGGEGGKFFCELLRAAMRTFGILPVGRADEDFAVALAGFAMEFVDWHEGKLFQQAKNSSAVFCPAGTSEISQPQGGWFDHADFCVPEGRWNPNCEVRRPFRTGFILHD
jgi:hypothetical protein